MDSNYTIRVALPLDTDGFLRRECPNCGGQFKWHHGPANAEAEQQSPPPAYSCPLCGRPAANDAWYTPAQIELATSSALHVAHEAIHDSLESALRGRKGLTYKRSRAALEEVTDPLVEPDDMVIVASPCHDFEPIKVPEVHTGILYCLICGAAFTV
ncbi:MULTISPECIES: hypothetical protein [Micrococcaceae]|uniref:hypothetical protein n=1 Tax=Micrococcaceae TaxID=1268 RepID=UPI001C8EB69B|nr:MULTISPECIES: hypothetical protein [Micrococcaceae]